MIFGTQASADGRVLISAALIGSGLGLGLGAVYMVGGMAQHASDHQRTARMAQAAAGAYSEAVLQAAEPGAVRLARPAAGAAFANLGAVGSSKLSLSEARKAGQKSAKSDLECLTQAVYYEARGESHEGQYAVAQVVMNRVKHPAFPKSVCGVVFQGAGRRTGCQFSFACDGSMRRGREASAWRQARKVAAKVLSGVALAEVGSATHFHTTGVSPAWGAQMRRVAQVGMHVFYRFTPRKAAQPVLQAAAPQVGEATVLTAGTEAVPDLRLTPALLQPAAPEAATGAEPSAAPSPEVKPAEAPSATPAEAAALPAAAATTS